MPHIDYKEGTMQVRLGKRQRKELGAFLGNSLPSFFAKGFLVGINFRARGKSTLSHPEPLSMLSKSCRHIHTYVLDVQREVYLYHTFFSTG